MSDIGKSQRKPEVSKYSFIQGTFTSDIVREKSKFFQIY